MEERSSCKKKLEFGVSFGRIDQLEYMLNEEYWIRRMKGVKRIQQMVDVLEERKRFHRSARRCIERSCNILKEQQFKEMYETYFGYELDCELKCTDLELNLYELNHKEFLKKLSNHILPDIERIILNCPSECEESIINTFLDNSIPNRIEEFWFNYLPAAQLKFNAYLSLYIAVQSVRNMICLFNICLSQKEFENFMAASKHCDSVDFYDCFIPTDKECDFTSITVSNIRTLGLSKTGDNNNSKWEENPNRFRNIVKGINNCNSLRNSITRISVEFCAINEIKGKEILEEIGLENIFLYFN